MKTPGASKLLVMSLAAALGGCAATRENRSHYTPLSAADPVGRIYDYTRSNRDGSLPERIVIFRRSATEIDVYKSVERCRNAAYVTAVLDPQALEPVRLVAGRVGPDGEQQPFGIMELDPATRRLSALLESSDGEVRDSVIAQHTPWHLYDFDLASLTIVTPHLLRPTEGFSFGLVLVWPEGGKFLTYRGLAQARFERFEDRGGKQSLRYEMAGDAFGSAGGTLWLDADERHILDAEFGLPNHAEYKDFKLELKRVSDGGEEEWSRLLAAHHRDCPA